MNLAQEVDLILNNKNLKKIFQRGDFRLAGQVETPEVTLSHVEIKCNNEYYHIYYSDKKYYIPIKEPRRSIRNSFPEIYTLREEDFYQLFYTYPSQTRLIYILLQQGWIIDKIESNKYQRIFSKIMEKYKCDYYGCDKRVLGEINYNQFRFKKQYKYRFVAFSNHLNIYLLLIVDEVDKDFTILFKDRNKKIISRKDYIPIKKMSYDSINTLIQEYISNNKSTINYSNLNEAHPLTNTNSLIKNYIESTNNFKPSDDIDEIKSQLITQEDRIDRGEGIVKECQKINDSLEDVVLQDLNKLNITKLKVYLNEERKLYDRITKNYVKQLEKELNTQINKAIEITSNQYSIKEVNE